MSTEADFADSLMRAQGPVMSSAYDPTQFTQRGTANHKVAHNVSIEAYANPSERRRTIAGFLYQPELSDKRTAVYSDPAKNRTVIGYKGTDPTSARDLITDARLTLGTGRRSKHFQEASERFLATKKAKPFDKLYNVGHSLGSFSAYNVSHRYNKSTDGYVGFNTPGSLPGLLSSGIQNVYQTPAQKRMSKISTFYTNTFDPVSILAQHRTNTIRTPKRKSWNPHALDVWF